MNVNEYVEIEIERSQIEKSEQKRPDCKNQCGGHGDGWGSLGGFCSYCKHKPTKPKNLRHRTAKIGF